MSTSPQRKPFAFGAPARRTVRVSEESLVRTGSLEPGGPAFPLLVEPSVEGLDAVAWAGQQREWIEERLAEHGALLFRGFGIDSAERFQDFLAAASGEPLEYTERSSPRKTIAGHIYTSTEHPPDQEIFLHNEQSYNLRFPQKIAFFCLTAPREGGATPIADCRRVLSGIDPAVRRRFAEQGYLYARNFGGGLGLPWQTAFQTTDRAAVEAYCQANRIDFEWQSGDRLRTRQIRPVVARHPRSGALSWCNHATFFHVSTLPPAVRDTLLAGVATEDLPNSTWYGDGAPIETEVLEALRALYRSEQRAFPWRQGDVLLLDNLLVAHGREPFAGERRILTGMADLVEWERVGAGVEELESRNREEHTS